MELWHIIYLAFFAIGTLILWLAVTSPLEQE